MTAAHNLDLHPTGGQTAPTLFWIVGICQGQGTRPEERELPMVDARAIAPSSEHVRDHQLVESFRDVRHVTEEVLKWAARIGVVAAAAVTAGILISKDESSAEEQPLPGPPDPP